MGAGLEDGALGVGELGLAVPSACTESVGVSAACPDASIRDGAGDIEGMFVAGIDGTGDAAEAGAVSGAGALSVD